MLDIERYRKRKAKEYQRHKKIIVKKQIERRKNDIQYKLSHRYRNLLVKAIRRGYSDKTIIGKLLTISEQDFRDHIERQFYGGMTWEAYGGRDGKGWELDHIKEMFNFDLTDDEQLKECFHYKNIRPLWAKDNRKRNRKEDSKNQWRVE